ncbi:MAG: hypothetical protein OEW17_04250, partial [Gemmatimonadota bacterium]|nr:hypothetical protein [Gemmatimonadota bacterium]
RWRRPLRWLETDPIGAERSLFVLLDPTFPVQPGEVTSVLHWAGHDGRGLLLAGTGAEALMECFGYGVDRRLDSVMLRTVTRPSSTGGAEGWPMVAGLLAATTVADVADSSRRSDATIHRCQVPPVARVTPLLQAATGRLAGVRLERGDVDGEVLLFADATPFRNRALRDTPAGIFALDWVSDRYDRVIFEEGRHGFGEGGSLLAATIDWSRRSPWGWAMWQALAVGIVALASAAVRFGQPVRLEERKRRSPLEHVKALATALAAARGHDVAIGLMVHGLRRRLGGRRKGRREEWRRWVEDLPQSMLSARARRARATLVSLTRPGQPATGVLQAADAVEDLWEEMHR